ncbi:membrane protein [Rhodopirellula sp. SWK7]|uniref:membrane protein n=1 Tax=Rhodopirellula sp. SWK7 TaxID=595460 RepID=UPI0002BD4512|nr:membrane protein [Rhodopirellula sp. SWK7]EMI46125.1 membrane protein [Rhodopirellula sp. SWK7]
MTAVSRTEKNERLSVSLVRRAYLIAVWLWLLVCLLFPTWTGKSHRYDTGSEQWQTNGAFGITGPGNPMTSLAPIWNPPRSSGGLPTVVRWPLAPIEAENSIEIQIAATLWRFSNGLFFAGLFALVLRWTKCVRESDRVLLVAGAIAVALLTANIVLAGIGAASMGYALISEVVLGVLIVAMALGLIFGGFVLRVGERDASPLKVTPATEATSPDSVAVTDPPKPSKMSAMRSLNWWWRVPAYLVFQFFVWGLVASQAWPVGRDVFGPYQVEPNSVVFAFWIQFILLPFFARRLKVFGLSQLLIIVLIYVLPDWPRGGNVFAPFIRVPASIWPLFWIQFAATLVLFWRAPYLVKQLTRMRRQSSNGASS